MSAPEPGVDDSLRPGEWPAPSAFRRLAYSSTVILNKTLYIDGGYISWENRDQTVANDNNSTLTLDLSSSWNNQSITFGVIPKLVPGPPSVHYGSAWPAPDAKSLYIFGGMTSRQEDADSGVWQLTPTGPANGTWTRVPDPPSTGFRPRIRPGGGAAAAAAGKGYFLGGLAMPGNDGEQPPFSASPGLLTWDMGANRWTNESAAGWAPSGAATFSRVEYVPSFGAQGVLIALGGEGTDASLAWTGDFAAPLAFDQVGVYDIAARTWYTQRARGGTADGVPSARELFCSVGADGGNGTYEIFVYGGEAGNEYWAQPDPAQQAANATNSDKVGVHVLSLPSFSWHRSHDRSSGPRYGHACATAGDRQMISVGGLNASMSPLSNFFVGDSRGYGLGVFDMTALQWKDGYDADAGRYESPDVVKQWTAANPLAPQWSDPRLASVFQYRATLPGAAPSSAPSSPSSPPSGRPGALGSARTWIIVGCVLGGVSLLTALLFVVRCVVRRRRRRFPWHASTRCAPAELSCSEKPELPERSSRGPWKKPTGGFSEKAHSWFEPGKRPLEVHADHKGELDGSPESSPRYEMPGETVPRMPPRATLRSELPAGWESRELPSPPTCRGSSYSSASTTRRMDARCDHKTYA